MAEGHLIYITEKDLLAVITTNPDHQGGGVEVQDGGIGHPDADLDHHLEENVKETETEIGTVTEVGTEIERETGTRTEIQIGREGGGVTGKVRREMMGFHCQRRKL